MNEFLEQQRPSELDESCLEEIPAESFMVGLNGGALPQETPEAMLDMPTKPSKEKE